MFTTVPFLSFSSLILLPVIIVSNHHHTQFHSFQDLTVLLSSPIILHYILTISEAFLLYTCNVKLNKYNFEPMTVTLIPQPCTSPFFQIINKVYP